jgi:hypothetical protein
LRIPTFRRAEHYTFPTQTGVERCISTEHKTDDLSLETIGGMVNTVKTLIEIQVKTLEHDWDLLWILVLPTLRSSVEG